MKGVCSTCIHTLGKVVKRRRVSGTRNNITLAFNFNNENHKIDYVFERSQAFCSMQKQRLLNRKQPTFQIAIFAQYLVIIACSTFLIDANWKPKRSQCSNAHTLMCHGLLFFFLSPVRHRAARKCFKSFAIILRTWLIYSRCRCCIDIFDPCLPHIHTWSVRIWHSDGIRLWHSQAVLLLSTSFRSARIVLFRIVCVCTMCWRKPKMLVNSPMHNELSTKC